MKQLGPTGTYSYFHTGQDPLSWHRSGDPNEHFTFSGLTPPMPQGPLGLDSTPYPPVSGSQSPPAPPPLVRAVGVVTGALPLNRGYAEDAQGSVEATTDAAGGVTSRYVIDAWGNILSGAPIDNPFSFGGGYGYWRDADLGLYYVRARWLNPQTGSWLSVDPVLTEPRYAYVRNSPTMLVDPTGMEPTSGTNVWEGLNQFARAYIPGVDWVEHEIDVARTTVEVTEAVWQAAALSAYGDFYHSLPADAQKFLPAPNAKGVQRWVSDLEAGFLEGFKQEFSDTLEPARWLKDKAVSYVGTALRGGWYGVGSRAYHAAYNRVTSTAHAFVDFWRQQYHFLRQNGLDWRGLLKHYVLDPASDLLKRILSLGAQLPHWIGEMLGRIAFELLLALLIELATLGAGTLAEAANVGRLGIQAQRLAAEAQKLGKLVQGLEKYTPAALRKAAAARAARIGNKGLESAARFAGTVLERFPGIKNQYEQFHARYERLQKGLRERYNSLKPQRPKLRPVGTAKAEAEAWFEAIRSGRPTPWGLAGDERPHAIGVGIDLGREVSPKYGWSGKRHKGRPKTFRDLHPDLQRILASMRQQGLITHFGIPTDKLKTVMGWGDRPWRGGPIWTCAEWDVANLALWSRGKGAVLGDWLEIHVINYEPGVQTASAKAACFSCSAIFGGRNVRITSGSRPAPLLIRWTVNRAKRR